MPNFLALALEDLRILEHVLHLTGLINSLTAMTQVISDFVFLKFEIYIPITNFCWLITCLYLCILQKSSPFINNVLESMLLTLCLPWLQGLL